MNDNVTRPMHYRKGKIETIKYLESTLSKEQFIGFLNGNALKYLSRWDKKGGVEDLQKAQWYITQMIRKVSECK